MLLDPIMPPTESPSIPLIQSSKWNRTIKKDAVISLAFIVAAIAVAAILVIAFSCSVPSIIIVSVIVGAYSLGNIFAFIERKDKELEEQKYTQRFYTLPSISPCP